MKIGQVMPVINLPAIDGNVFNNQSLKGKKYLLTFFRFATCPFCNMRIAQLVKLKKQLGNKIEFVAIFEAEQKYLAKHANKHVATFPILADNERKYYKMFGVKKSLIGMFKGMVFRLPLLLKAALKGYIPLEVSSRFLIMPVSFLVNEQGVIQEIYYGQDEGDHMPLNTITNFANKI